MDWIERNAKVDVQFLSYETFFSSETFFSRTMFDLVMGICT